MQFSRVLRSLAVVLSLPIVGVSCLGETTAPREIPIEETNFAASLGVDLATSTRTANGAYYRDLVVGTGATVAAGETLTVRYTGWLSNGTQFDSNVAATLPFSFVLGRGEVIAGWDETVPGMRVGGRRQLIIPPRLAYGSGGYGVIPGNAVVVFVAEIISAT